MIFRQVELSIGNAVVKVSNEVRWEYDGKTMIKIPFKYNRLRFIWLGVNQAHRVFNSF